MCNAFTCIITQEGKVLWQFGMDSHDEIIQKYNLKDYTDKRDKLNFARVEISPANRNYLQPDKWTLKIDEAIQPTWWSKWYKDECWKAWKEWKKELDKILVYKSIIHPFRDVTPPEAVLPKHLRWLKQWALVRESVGQSVGELVRDSVEEQVGDSVWALVGALVEEQVWEVVRKLAGDLVGEQVGVSAWDSVGAYFGSFFRLNRNEWKYTKKIKTKGYPFQSAVNLWEAGLVPSYDGKTWRLHGGKDGGILWSGEVSVPSVRPEEEEGDE